MGRSSLSLKDPVQLFFVCGMRLLDVYHKKSIPIYKGF